MKPTGEQEEKLKEQGEQEERLGSGPERKNIPNQIS